MNSMYIEMTTSSRHWFILTSACTVEANGLFAVSLSSFLKTCRFISIEGMKEE
jgi:hypothetical protein